MLRERHNASHEPRGWGDYHLTLGTWFISQITRQITRVGRGPRRPVRTRARVNVRRRSEECGRPHGVRPESPGDPVYGPLRFPPARRAVVERQLPRGPGGRAQPGGADADEPQPR